MVTREAQVTEPSSVMKIDAKRVAIGIVLLGATLWLVTRLYAGLDAAQATRVAFIVGIWGVLVTLAGFALTLWQLHHTANAAGAASQAVQKLRQDVGSFDMIGDLHHITANIDMAMDRLSERKFARATVSYENIRRSLNKYLSATDSLSTEKENAIKDFLSHLIAAAGNIEELGDGTEFDTSDLRLNLRQLYDLVISEEAAIRSKIGE